VRRFLNWLLEKRKIITRNLDAIKPGFSKVCNRIKELVKRCTERGTLNWLKLIFARFLIPSSGDKYGRIDFGITSYYTDPSFGIKGCF
jgi:hypothetical protein